MGSSAWTVDDESDEGIDEGLVLPLRIVVG